MGSPKPETIETILDQILGFLNFSSGNHDPTFFSNVNLLFAGASPEQSNSTTTPESRAIHLLAREMLYERLAFLKDENKTFRDCDQAYGVLTLTFDFLLPKYLRFHRDLLFHQTEEILFNSFFIAKCFREILKQVAAEDYRSLDDESIVDSAISQLNDYIGHRPVATLESQKIEPYANERVCPVPLFVSGGSIAIGRYREMVEIAINILRETPSMILRAAHFDPNRLLELAIDPRAFDFDHPINRRPNHHFGQWDEHQIDGDGFYTRFIVHQVTLDALRS